MTKKQKDNLLMYSANAVECGHQMLDWLETLHENIDKFIPDVKDQEKLITENEDFKLAQEDMDKLYQRMKKLNIF